MDRASDSGSEGWGFESLPVYQIKERIPLVGILSFISCFAREGTRMIKCNADERCPLRLDAAEHLFSPKAKMQTSPFRCTKNKGKAFAFPLFFVAEGLEGSNATVRWTVAGEGWMQRNLNFLPQLWEKMQTSPVAVSDIFLGFQKPSSAIDRCHSLASFLPPSGGSRLAPPSGVRRPAGGRRTDCHVAALLAMTRYNRR